MTGRPLINEAEMVALWHSGMSAKQIAAHFGVQSPAVTRRLNQVGIKVERRGMPVKKDRPPSEYRRRYSQYIAERCDELAEHLEAGRSLLEASFAMRVSIATIYELFARIRRPMGGQAR